MNERDVHVECNEHKCHLKECFHLHYPEAFRDEGEDTPQPLTAEQEREIIALMHEDMQREGKGYGD